VEGAGLHPLAVEGEPEGLTQVEEEEAAAAPKERSCQA
jgi:hypothetical protein